MNNWWKYGLAFLGGAIVTALVYKNSREMREICAKAIDAAETVKKSGGDLLAEADAKRKAEV